MMTKIALLTLAVGLVFYPPSPSPAQSIPEPVGTICGTKFLDRDLDGVRDPGEPPLSGFDILLDSDQGILQVVTTNDDGEYCFLGVPPGNYSLLEIAELHWLQTAPPTGAHDVTLGPGQTLTDLDFGNGCCRAGPRPALDDLLNTGFHQMTAQPLPFGDPDEEWTVVHDDSGGPVPRPANVVRQRSLPNPLPGSTWITAVANAAGTDMARPPPAPTEYEYRYCFCLERGFSDPFLELDVRADDEVQFIELNGRRLFTGPGGAFSGPPLHVETTGRRAFRVGRNCLNIRVRDTARVITGLNLTGRVTATNGFCCRRLGRLPPFGAPDVAIAAPVDAAIVNDRRSITFRGSATDAEGRDLSAALTWASDLDGALGTGGAVAARLSVGSHTITATATDSEGLEGLDLITVTVVPRNTAPNVIIRGPTNGAGFDSRQPVTLEGSAGDAEDGDLTPDLTWTSNRDGALGSGGTLSMILSEGTHRLTARVVDSGGLRAADTITVKVRPDAGQAAIRNVDRVSRQTIGRALRRSARQAGIVVETESMELLSVGDGIVANVLVEGFEELTPEDFARGANVGLVFIGLQTSRTVPPGLYTIRMELDLFADPPDPGRVVLTNLQGEEVVVPSSFAPVMPGDPDHGRRGKSLAHHDDGSLALTHWWLCISGEYTTYWKSETRLDYDGAFLSAGSDPRAQAPAETVTTTAPPSATAATIDRVGKASRKVIAQAMHRAAQDAGISIETESMDVFSVGDGVVANSLVDSYAELTPEDFAQGATVGLIFVGLETSRTVSPGFYTLSLELDPAAEPPDLGRVVYTDLRGEEVVVPSLLQGLSPGDPDDGRRGKSLIHHDGGSLALTHWCLWGEIPVYCRAETGLAYEGAFPSESTGGSP